MEHLYFLRHFQTASNKSGLLHGRSLDIPIESGHPILCDHPIDAIYCSNALRCRQTLKYFTESHKNIPICYTDLLLERSLGSLESQPRDEAVNAYPELFHGRKLQLTCTPPQGESFEQFKNRAHQFINTYVKNNEHKNILICSHNQFLKMLYFILMDLDLSQENWESINFPFGEIKQIL